VNDQRITKGKFTVNVGRVNDGTLALRTTREMHDPAVVPANGAATLAAATRPELANVTETLAVPVIP
jgi:hypothetical protein